MRFLSPISFYDEHYTDEHPDISPLIVPCLFLCGLCTRVGLLEEMARTFIPELRTADHCRIAIPVQSMVLLVAPKSSYVLTSLSPKFGFIPFFSNIYQNDRYKVTC